MERQSSFGSAASGKSSATKIVKDAQKGGEAVESQNANNALLTALFGVLFTLAKEKYSDSAKIAVATVVVDFFLILAIMLNLEYPWAVDPHNPLFKFFWSIEIHKPLAVAGYKFYVVVFYILSAMLYASVGVCVWVAWCFKNDSFPFLWPIKFVRVVASIFFGMFYIAALNIFLVILECAPEHGVWTQHIWHVECLAMPHLIHLVVAILSSVIFAVAALLLVIADHELQPQCRSLLAAPHSMCELKAQLAKTVITVVDILLWKFPKVQGVTFALCTILTFYYHLKQLPYYTTWMNSFRLCFFAVHAWVATHLCILVFTVRAHYTHKGSMGFIEWETENYSVAKRITDSMAYGVPFIFFGAGLLGAIRLYYFFRVALKFQILQQQPNLYSKRVHRFNDEKDVEICTRVARVWDEDGNLDQECVDLAEIIVRAGIQQFPQSPYLHIVYSNILIDCRQQLQSGWSQLEEARRMPLNLSYRFSIFTREQEHKQKAAVSSSGESAADLVSYVEFQRNWRLIQSYHKATLAAMREFWRLLLRDNVNMNSLTSAFRKIEQMEKLADRTYKVVLERYPKAVRLLRSYGNFLEMVKNDPWTAAEYYTEAEKQEEALENAENDLAGEDGLNMRNSAIITINAQGIIQMANKHASKMLGYAKGDLDGKNVSCIMPQPFSSRHNTYLRNYVTTGKAKILDQLRDVVALHRDRYVFPIKICVTKTQGTGADAIFMGLLKEVDNDPNTLKAWVMPNGVTLCADQSFTDYAGWAPNDLIGKPFSNTCGDPEAVAKFLEIIAHASEEEIAQGDVQTEMDAVLLHKYAEDVPVTIRAELGGTAGQRLIVCNMTRRGELYPTAVFDSHGRVLFCNQALCSLLGMNQKDMRGRDIGTLLPQPFGYLHHRWIKDAEAALPGAKMPPSSCRAGAVHSLLSSNGVHVPVRVVITTREYLASHVLIVRMARITPEEALDEQRLSVTTDQHGHILAVNANHPSHGFSTAGVAALPPPGASISGAKLSMSGAPKPEIFGFAPENLVGRKLYEAVDVFNEWHEQGHSVMHAVKALAQHSTVRPGSAWRVGILPHYMSAELEKTAHKSELAESKSEREAQQAEGVLQADNGRRMRGSSSVQRTSMSKYRAAIMQVVGPEHTPNGTHYTVRLWRPEMLTGVIELNERMAVVKADAAAGLIFGVPSYSMHQQPFSRFLRLDAQGAAVAKPGTASGAGGGGKQPVLSREHLLGAKHVKGGMKGKMAHKTGPRRIFEARHVDGMPLQISCQVALKNGNSTSRLMAAVKPLNLIRGNVAVLHAIMSGEDLDHYTIDGSIGPPSLLRARAPHAHGPHSPDEVPGAMDYGTKSPAGKVSASGAGEQKKKYSSAGAGGIEKGEKGKATEAAVPARTLQQGEAAHGSGATRSDDPITTAHVELDGLRSDSGGRQGSAGAGKPQLDDPLATARTIDDPLATARNVELEFEPTPRPNGDGAPATPPPAAGAGKQDGEGGSPGTAGSGPGRPQSALKRQQTSSGQLEASGSLSATGSGQGRPPISDDSAMNHHARKNSGGLKDSKDTKELLSKRHLTRDWDHIDHVDPDEVPIPHDAEYDIDHHVGAEKDMALSRGSSSHDDDGSDSEEEDDDEDDGDMHLGKNTQGAAEKMTREEALQRKRTMATLEPSERAGYIRGVKRVKEWLASGYYFDRRDAEPADDDAGGSSSRPGSGPALPPVEEEEEGQEVERSHSRSLNGGRHGSRSGALRQKSGLSPHSGAGGADTEGGRKGEALNLDDQLVTLDELAADVDNHGHDDGEDEEEEEEGEETRSEQLDREERERVLYNRTEDRKERIKAKKRGESGRKRGGAEAGSAAATVGGTTVGVSGGGGDGKSDAGDVAHGASGAGMNRGRRLKRLLKLLSGRQVHQGVSRLRLHVLIVLAGLLLVHAACFMLLIIYINKQKLFITEISAAGEAIDRSHYNAMYTRAIEAATRFAGFNSSDIPDLATRLTSDVDRLEYLHQGLYLGFTSLKRPASQKLSDLWDAPQWNVTEYMDTKVPTLRNTMMTLWNLGNEFIAAVREVAFYAANNKLLLADPLTGLYPSTNGTVNEGTTATNVTLTANRFWLFVKANVGESLYVGYLRVLNTLLLLAQDNISMLKTILIVLLLVEGCAVCVVAVCYVFWLLWKATRARAALFTVFLVIPQAQIKTLASRHIKTSQDDDSDDEEELEAKQEGAGGGAGGADDAMLDSSSFISGAPSKLRDKSYTVAPSEKSVLTVASPMRPKASISFHPEAKPEASGGSVLGRIKRAISGDQSVATAASGPTRRFHTRKRLTHTTSDIKHLAWPFFAWGALICAIYLVSYLQFYGVEKSLVNLKMFERSTAQASRAMFYVNELALETDPVVQAALQPIVREEASWLDTVYRTTLYGGTTLSDSDIDGAHDSNTGSLFAKQVHAQLLFEATTCFRSATSTCLAETDRFYEVTRHAIDPMMRRLMAEATLLGLDAVQDINATSSRWQYVWEVARVDLHEGLTDLVDSYRGDSLAAFQAQGTLHIVIFAVSWVLWAAYLWLLLKPYLQVQSTETKRVAELLSQLPPELDVEGMVQESWLVVADTELERGALSVLDAKGQSVAKAAFKGAVTALSAIRLASVMAAARMSVGGQQQDALDDSASAADGAGGAAAVAAAFKSKLANAQRSSASGAAAAKAGKGADGDGNEDEPGDDVAVEEPAKGHGAGGLTAAPQVPVLGSSLYGSMRGSLDAKPQRPAPPAGRRNSGTRISPTGSAEVMMRPGSAGAGGGSRPPSAAALDGKERPGSMERMRKNKVVPVAPAAAEAWAAAAAVAVQQGAVPSSSEPRPMVPTVSSAVTADSQRPVSPLLDFPSDMVLPPVADDRKGAAEGGTSAGKGQSAKPLQTTASGTAVGEGRSPSPYASEAGGAHSPYHFNKAITMQSNMTREWGSGEQRWQPSYMRGAPQAAASQEAGGGGGGGDDAVAAAAALAAAQASVTELHACGPVEYSDTLVTPMQPAVALPGSPAALPGCRQASAGQLALPPPAPVAAAIAAAAAARERLGGSFNSAPGSLLIPAAATSAAAAAAAAGGDADGSFSGSVRVVDRRSSLVVPASAPGSRPMSPVVAAARAAGLGSRPVSPLAAAAPPRLNADQPPVAAAAPPLADLVIPYTRTASAPRSGPPSRLGTPPPAVGVVGRRSSLDVGSSRPGSRLGGLAPSAASIAMPPPPPPPAFTALSASREGALSPLGRLASGMPSAAGGGRPGTGLLLAGSDALPTAGGVGPDAGASRPGTGLAGSGAVPVISVGDVDGRQGSAATASQQLSDADGKGEQGGVAGSLLKSLDSVLSLGAVRQASSGSARQASAGSGRGVESPSRQGTAQQQQQQPGALIMVSGQQLPEAGRSVDLTAAGSVLKTVSSVLSTGAGRTGSSGSAGGGALASKQSVPPLSLSPRDSAR